MMDHHFKHDQPTKTSCGLCCTKIEDFSVTIGNKTLVRDVNIHLHCGELTAIVGPNGAGKSTLLKAILGVLPHKGELKFLDSDGKRRNRPLIGYVPQNLEFDPYAPLSVYDLFGATTSSFPVWLKKRKDKHERVRNLLRKVKVDHVIDERIGNLSGGELQRVMLALALEPIPDILVLDEPVSGVDQNGLAVFYALVDEMRKKHDLTILLVSHDLSLMAKYADRVILIDKEMLATGTPYQVFNHPSFISLFGKLQIGGE